MSAIRAVIDTQVFLRAVINRKSLPATIVFDMAQAYELVTSQAINDEVRNVLHRPKLRAKFPHLTDEIAQQVMILLTSAETVTPVDIPSVSRDPKDDIFLACALSSSATHIVSEDNDLLVLNPYEDIQIVNVLDFYSLVKQQ